MAIFELEANGKTFEIEAPDMGAAAAAFQKMQGGAQSADGVNALMDVVLSTAIGVPKGAIGMAGAAGEARRLASMGTDWLGKKLGYDQDSIDSFKSGAARVAALTPQGYVLANAPTADEIQKNVEGVTGEFYKPKTTAGEYGQTVGEFLPNAIGGGAGFVRKAAQVVVPALVSEAAGQWTKANAPAYEPYARVGGAVLSGGATGVAMRPNTAGRVVAEAIGPNSDAAVNAAHALMQNSPVPLTWAEAIQQVTNSGTKLGDVQRVVEASQRGGAVMAPFMAERPNQINAAVRANLDQVAAPGVDPYTVGPRASQAATGAIDDTRAWINNQTRPLYQAAELDRVPPGQYQQLAQDPRYVAALEQVRTHPEIGPEFAHLPDNAVPVVDQVKKLLNTRAEVTPQADATERFLGAMRGTAAENAGNAATRSSAAQAQAVAEQAALRQQHLNPLEQGPLGRAAQAQNTEGVVNAVLPIAPLPGSAPQVGQAIRHIGARDPEAAANIVRQRMEATQQQATRDLQGGPNEWGGANYRARLYGNPQAQENVRTAINETAGPAVLNDTDRLMEALQATGRRQHPGSKTEFNRIMTRALEGGNPVAEVVTSAAQNPLGMLGRVKDVYQNYRYGSNTEALARLLTDPAAFDEILRAARSRQSGPGSQALAAALLADADRRQRESQQKSR